MDRAAEGTPRHLVLILADQLRLDMLGAYHRVAGGGDGAAALPEGVHLTPRLDTLARRATVFERHFTPCPLCLPAKCSIVTGLPPARHGAIINGFFNSERRHGVIRPGVELLPVKLARAGYRVVFSGVQHIRTEPALPTLIPDGWFLGPAGPSDHQRELMQRGLYLGDTSAFRDPVIDFDRGRPVVHTAISARTGVFPLREDMFFDAVVADRTVEAIHRFADDRANDQTPLALFVMFWLPHPPLWAPRKFAEMIDPETVKLPATVGRWYAGQPALQLANIPGQIGAHVTAEHWRKVWAMYMGMVALLDQCVGKVLAALDHVGLFHEALVAFSSDHGEMLGSHGLFQKNCLYDESVRTPLLLKLPGQTASRRVQEFTDHLDLCVTLAEHAGVGPINDSPGRSLRPMCLGQRMLESPRDAVFAGYDGNAGRGFRHRMVRTRTHKFIHNIGDRAELYDLVEDPYETRNIAGQAAHAGVENELRHLLARWMHDVGDDQPPPRTTAGVSAV